MMSLMTRRLSAFLVAAALLVGTAATSAGTGNPPSPTNAQIRSVKERAARLSRQISQDSEQEQIAGERYDQARVVEAEAKTRFDSFRAAVRREKVAVAGEKRRVLSAAVEEYVFGSSSAAQFGAALTSAVPNEGSLIAYAGTASRNLHDAVVKLVATQARLEANEGNARKQIAIANGAAQQAANAEATAASDAANARSSLRSVKGRIAKLIAEQEAAAALAAAEAAAAARAEAAREADAQDAYADSSVLAALGEVDPAAAAAAEEAQNQAAIASEGGHPALEPAGSTAQGNIAVATAEKYLGVPYVWGGAGPLGFDCSGLTMVAWAAAGVNLTHSAWYQYQESQPVALSAIEPGDLLFFSFPDDGPNPITHVAMYVGSGPFGSETIIQAPETGETVSYSPMYYYGFVGAGRPE
jgi:peptidoglycan DL-endopeptidase CwlO